MLTGALGITALVLVVSLALTFVVARRALRVFIRLALLAFLALALLAGYAWWRWQDSNAGQPARSRQAAPARR
jgi:4-amino-4-deoxy-L-arabinose transferase-like glycosyltransferase